jgi:hypothetical protein
MSRATWTTSAVNSDLEPYQRSLNRFIDPEGGIGILNLVDTVEEALILEGVLYRNREISGQVPTGMHRLLARPFEMRDPQRPSRFRGGYEPGVLYSAETVTTAALERGFHKVKALRESPEMDAPSLQRQTLINFDVRTDAIDIRVAPYASDKYELQSSTSYEKSREFALVARQAEAGAIIYSSARGVGDGPCVAVLSATALKNGQPNFLSNAWDIRVDRERAIWENSETLEKLQFLY